MSEPEDEEVPEVDPPGQHEESDDDDAVMHPVPYGPGAPPPDRDGKDGAPGMVTIPVLTRVTDTGELQQSGGDGAKEYSEGITPPRAPAGRPSTPLSVRGSPRGSC